MRTTLEIADDVLGAARERAGQRGCAVGQVISDLARRGLKLGVEAYIHSSAN